MLLSLSLALESSKEGADDRPGMMQSDHEDDAEDQQAVNFDFNLAVEHAQDSTSLELSESAKTSMIQSAMRRICAAGTDGASPAVWVPLVARLVTRGLQSEGEGEGEGEGEEVANTRREALRQIIFEFIVADLQSR